MSDEEIQRTGFENWYYELLDKSCNSCLIRDVIRRQKNNLFNQWMQIKPMIDSQDYIRDISGIVIGINLEKKD